MDGRMYSIKLNSLLLAPDTIHALNVSHPRKVNPSHFWGMI